MTHKPPSAEYGFRRDMSTADDYLQHNAPRHEQRIIKLVKDQKLTTDGVQWSTWVETTSTPTSAAADYIATQPTTLNWPGLQGFYVDEMEAGLTGAFMVTSTGVTTGAAVYSTMAYRWELMDNDESTYTAISTWKMVAKAGTSTAVEKTVSGYASLGTGYNKLPLLIRLRGYAESGKMHKMHIKNSSYIAVKAKKSS